MKLDADHVQLRYQLTDDLQIEQAYTCYVDGSDVYPKSVLHSALSAHFTPVLGSFSERYKPLHRALVNTAYLNNDNTRTETDI